VSTVSFLTEAISILFTVENILLILFVSIIGVILGAIPGIGPTLAMALFFPFTFTMEPATGLSVMAVLFATSTYGGSIPAILLRIPGTPGSAATLLDGYPMTQAGRGAEALGLSAVSSWIGGAVGIIALLLFAPSLADLSLILGPPELFLLAVFGLSTVAAVTQGNILKSLAAVSLGVFFASIGTDPIVGQPRFTFGIRYLQGGINIIVLLVGLFAISQVIKLTVEQIEIDSGNTDIQGNVMKGAITAVKSPVNAMRSATIGTFVGAVPGAGLPAANFLAYLVALMSSSNSDSYGQGEPNGVIAGEAANNGSAMGSLIPAMALSIPGGPASAVFIGVMLSYGITPGPSAFDGTLPYVVFVSIVLAQMIFLVMGLFAADKISKLIRLPTTLLVAGITMFALVGSFAVRNNVLDIGVAIFFGVLGYAMEKRDYSLIAFILAVILAPIAEKGYQRSMIIADGDWGIFVSSNIAIGLVIASVAVFMIPILFRLYENR